MDSEIFDNELFINIKKLLEVDKDILNDCIGDHHYVEMLALTSKDFSDLRKLAQLWLITQEREGDDIIYDIAIVAWRSAAALNVSETVRFMLELMEETEKLNIQSDVLMNDIEKAGKIADKATVAYLCDFIQLESYNEWTMITAVECLGASFEFNPDMENIIKAAMSKRFMNYENNSPGFNGFLIDHLTELKAVELAEDMEKAFAAGLVDESCIGIWEKTRRKLGVPGTGLVPDGVRVTPDPFAGIYGRFGELVEQLVYQPPRYNISSSSKKNTNKKKQKKNIRKKKNKGKR
jgi:hypothetical protein